MTSISRVLNDEPSAGAMGKAETPKVATITSPSEPRQTSPKDQPQQPSGQVVPASMESPQTEPAKPDQSSSPKQPKPTALKRTLSSSSSLSPTTLVSPSNLRFKRKRVPSDIRIYPLSKTEPLPINSAPPTIRAFSAADHQLRTPVGGGGTHVGMPNSANSTHSTTSTNSGSDGSAEDTPRLAHSFTNATATATGSPAVASPMGLVGIQGNKKMYAAQPSHGIQNPNALRYYNLQSGGQQPQPGSQPPGPPYPGDSGRPHIPMMSPLNSAHPSGYMYGGPPHTAYPSSGGAVMTPIQQAHPQSQKPSPYSKVQVEDIYEGPNGPGVGVKTYHFPHYVELQASSPYASSFKKAGSLPGPQSNAKSGGSGNNNSQSTASRTEPEKGGSESPDSKKERFLKLCGEVWDLLKN